MPRIIMSAPGWLLLALSLVSCGPSPVDIPLISPSVTPAPNVEVQADCFITFHLSAYADVNGNDTRDAEEKGLSDIEFIVNGNYAHSVAGGRATTDEGGEATIDTWSPGGCDDFSTDFAIDVVTPEYYEPSVEFPVSVESVQPSQEYEFGFYSVFTECGLPVTALAWVDADQDGLYDEEEETPLPDVLFIVRQVEAPLALRGEAFSDADGIAFVEVYDISCSEPVSEWEVTTEVPEGYVLTTPAVINLEDVDFDQPVPFGFYPAADEE